MTRSFLAWRESAQLPADERAFIILDAKRVGFICSGGRNIVSCTRTVQA
jgi:hypothetical protein